VGSGLTVVLGFLFLGRRPSRSPDFALHLPEPTYVGDWDDPPPLARHDERRRAIRRTGLPTPVHILEWKANRKAKPAEAYVLDRSTGGLRLAMEKPSAPGTVLAARPGSATPDYEWVKLVVRNCREVGDYFELGCQFESELELSKLLMFG
jgi:hypothetical protein